MSADAGDVALVGAAAAAADAHVREARLEDGVFSAELIRVAAVELLGFVEFRVAAARSVGADAADPAQPGLCADQFGGKWSGGRS